MLFWGAHFVWQGCRGYKIKDKKPWFPHKELIVARRETCVQLNLSQGEVGCPDKDPNMQWMKNPPSCPSVHVHKET